jgi:hypothetical protein
MVKKNRIKGQNTDLQNTTQKTKIEQDDTY